MLFKDISLIDQDCTIHHNQYVGVKDNLIDYIGIQMPKQPGLYGQEYDGKGKLLMPGFFNAHAHTPMVLMRGYGENLSLQDWLNTRIFPFENKLQGNDIYWATLLGIAEMLKFGTVSATDMYFFGEDMAKAILKSGMKFNLSMGTTCFDDRELIDLAIFQEAKALFADYHGARDGKLLIDLSIHAEYTSNPNIVRGISDYCKKIGSRMHVHISETLSEHEQCKQRHNGQTPVQYFESLGVFDNPSTAAHCVWVEDGDREILARHGVTVATCPISNLKLASGVCDIPKLLQAGVNVAIGTDSAASNNNLDMVEEMKFFALLTKGKYYDPTLIMPKQTIYAATAAGAKSQGRTMSGSIKVGNCADLIVINLNTPHLQPVHDLANQIVYAANGSDVVLTMVDGKVLYQNGEYLTIDIEKVLFEVEKSKNRILAELASR